MAAKIRLKSFEDIERLAEGGAILGRILDQLEEHAVVGAIPKELDQLAQQRIKEAGCTAAFLNYAPGNHQPFPAALCVSVNSAIVHGLPGKKPLKSGDIVGLDLGLVYQEKYYLDCARTKIIGEGSEENKLLLAVTKKSLELGINQAAPGNTIGDIGHAVQQYVESQGFSIITQLVGHGVGYDVHEPPQVPNFGKVGRGRKLVEGLVIAIEPMVTIGNPTVTTAGDGWTVAIASGQSGAHQEHTVAVTKDGPRILTQTSRFD